MFTCKKMTMTECPRLVWLCSDGKPLWVKHATQIMPSASQHVNSQAVLAVRLLDRSLIKHPSLHWQMTSQAAMVLH